MSAVSRHRDETLDRRYSLGERLWLARCAHPRSAGALAWVCLAALAASVLAVAR